jgi:hypothetical protein
MVDERERVKSLLLSKGAVHIQTKKESGRFGSAAKALCPLSAPLCLFSVHRLCCRQSSFRSKPFYPFLSPFLFLSVRCSRL